MNESEQAAIRQAARALADALACEPMMSEADAVAGGYVSVRDFAEAQPGNRGRDWAQVVLATGYRAGRAERVRVGRGYWYRPKQEGGA